MTDDEVTEGLVHMKVARSRLMRAAKVCDGINASSAHLGVLMSVAALDDAEEALKKQVGFLRMIEDAYALGEDGI